jgi:hypothetical protein
MAIEAARRQLIADQLRAVAADICVHQLDVSKRLVFKVTALLLPRPEAPGRSGQVGANAGGCRRRGRRPRRVACQQAPGRRCIG